MLLLLIVPGDFLNLVRSPKVKKYMAHATSVVRFVRFLFRVTSSRAYASWQSRRLIPAPSWHPSLRRECGIVQQASSASFKLQWIVRHHAALYHRCAIWRRSHSSLMCRGHHTIVSYVGRAGMSVSMRREGS
jgi:hypothetical protein